MYIEQVNERNQKPKNGHRSWFQMKRCSKGTGEHGKENENHSKNRQI